MQVVLLCWEKHLYDAMIYVYNSGMNDFISPMEVGKLLGAASYLCAQHSLSEKQRFKPSALSSHSVCVYPSFSFQGRNHVRYMQFD